MELLLGGRTGVGKKEIGLKSDRQKGFQTKRRKRGGGVLVEKGNVVLLKWLRKGESVGGKKSCSSLEIERKVRKREVREKEPSRGLGSRYG